MYTELVHGMYICIYVFNQVNLWYMYNVLYAIVHIFIFRGNDDNRAHVHGFGTFISLKRYIVFIICHLKYVDGAFIAPSANIKQNTHAIY